jgi:membrane-associated phospholipid phosphatase
MQAIDRFLFFGVDPVLALQRFIWAPLSEWLAFSYSFYALFYSISLAAIFMVGGRRALREGITAMCLGMSVTYVSYSLIPVAGPAMSMHFEVSLDLYYIKEVKEMLMDRSRISYDCFPSFHTAGSLIMSWLCWRHARRVFWVTLPMVASTPLACVYLRYHYVTDVLAGGLLFVAVAWVVPRLLADDPPTPSVELAGH